MKKKQKSASVRLLKKLEIGSLLGKNPGEYSGGHRQRASICRARINNPSVLVADEPAGNLDSMNSRQVLKILQRLNKESGTTIIMISHDPMIVSYTSRLVYLKDGNIETEVHRYDLSQREYYYKILEFSSSEPEDYLE